MFQLGIFLRALRPTRTALHHARFTHRPARIKKKKKLQDVIAVFVFSKSLCKNACKMLAYLCPCFHRSPTKLYPDLVSFACWIGTKFWSFTRKSGHLRSKPCPILCHLRTKLCPNFGRSRAILCPISCTVPFSQPSWDTNAIAELTDFHPFQEVILCWGR